MSYASGISNLQQTANTITPSETKSAIQSGGSDSPINEQTVLNVEHADQTNLSATGGLVAQALESSDTRAGKIASLQQAIAAGTYNVSSSDVADKIIRSLLD
jgi:negative regulator of flagellin synthesis FlgM